MEGESLIGVMLVVPAGIALGLSPATYPLVPVVGALEMLALGLCQGLVMVTADVCGGTLLHLSKLAPYRVAIERLLGVVLLGVLAYFTWRVLIWL